MLLSRKWGALKHLTELHLSGWGNLRQEGGPSAGALHVLFKHLEDAVFQVGARQGLVCSPIVFGNMMSGVSMGACPLVLGIRSL